MHRSHVSHALVAAVAVFALSVAGCSDDDDGSATSDTNATTAPTDAVATADAGSGNAGSGDAPAGESESSENPTTFGYQVDGDSGTTVVVETMADTEAGPQEMSQTWSITDKPRWMLYTNWVTGGEISLELTEGDSATVEIIRGHAVDPDNPFAGIEVVEVLETVEVTAGEPVTVTFP